MDRLKTSPRLFAAALLLELCALILLSRFGDFAIPGNASAFVGCGLVAGSLYLLAVASFESIAAISRPKVVWAAAILLRLSVFWMEPGAAFHQAVQDGQHQVDGGNPYAAAGASRSVLDQGARGDALPDLSSQLKQPKVPVFFGPGAELMAWGLARVGTPVWGYKLLFATADLLTVFLLLRLNTGAGRYRRTAWYAWNPLVVYSLTGGAHFGSLMILTLVAAMWALHRANPLDAQKPSWSWGVASAVFLGLSISVFPMPLLLLPVWIAALRPRSALVLVALALPAALAQWYGGGTVFHSLLSAWDTSFFNSPIIGWAHGIFADHTFRGSYHLPALATAAVLLAIYYRNDWRRGVLWVVGAVLILTPILEPWWVVWILPVAGWRRHYAWYILSLTIIISVAAYETNALSVSFPVLYLTQFLLPLGAWWFFERPPRDISAP